MQACRFLPFGFVLIHLHKRLISSSANVDVNETAVDLEISFKMLCLATPCANATKTYVTTKPEMSMTLSDLDDNEDNNE